MDICTCLLFYKMRLFFLEEVLAKWTLPTYNVSLAPPLVLSTFSISQLLSTKKQQWYYAEIASKNAAKRRGTILDTSCALGRFRCPLVKGIYQKIQKDKSEFINYTSLFSRKYRKPFGVFELMRSYQSHFWFG